MSWTNGVGDVYFSQPNADRKNVKKIKNAGAIHDIIAYASQNQPQGISKSTDTSDNCCCNLFCRRKLNIYSCLY